MEKLPTWVEVNLDNLLFNLRQMKAHVGEGVKLLLTVKADAYGHGAVQVAQASLGLVDMFGVATVDEARELERAGIRGNDILVLSPILEREIPLIVESGFAVTISSADFAGRIAGHAKQAGKTVDVHVEIDTGMGRTGIQVEGALQELVEISRIDGVNVAGVYTHFPSADEDEDFTREQIVRFGALVERMKEAGIHVPLVHSANSSALSRFRESHMAMVRPGLLAYGYLPTGDGSPVAAKPVMSWKSRLVQVRRIPAGRSISYGRTFTTKRETLLGVVPVGYGHGYPFRLSNGGEMLFRGERAPVLGRVTMDMTMIDLTDIVSDAEPGEEVMLFGGGEEGGIPLHEVASRAGTIPYEILCGISKRVPRMYLRNGKVEAFKSLLGVAGNTF
jgi:alanine racemase